eukprot:484451-Pyramimonas_sp.AAC.1
MPRTAHLRHHPDARVAGQDQGPVGDARGEDAALVHHEAAVLEVRQGLRGGLVVLEEHVVDVVLIIWAPAQR